MNKNLSVQPNINDKRLTKEVEGLDESGNYFKQNVVNGKTFNNLS